MGREKELLPCSINGLKEDNGQKKIVEWLEVGGNLASAIIIRKEFSRTFR